MGSSSTLRPCMYILLLNTPCLPEVNNQSTGSTRFDTACGEHGFPFQSRSEMTLRNYFVNPDNPVHLSPSHRSLALYHHTKLPAFRFLQFHMQYIHQNHNSQDSIPDCNTSTIWRYKHLCPNWARKILLLRLLFSPPGVKYPPFLLHLNNFSFPYI